MIDPLEVSDDAGGVADIGRLALGAFHAGFFGDVAAIVADGAADVDAPVIAAEPSCHIDQFNTCLLSGMLVEVEVERAASIEKIDDFSAMKDHFIEDVR